ncbi:MAG TPA: riboflavin synthase [Planctomycetota bacterium]|nr:riboflavin synthase [Planctomycetota bacterium]
MFTGIVTQRATVRGVRPAPQGALPGTVRIVLGLERPIAGLVPGDSVALDGCCLTAVSASADVAEFDVIPETLRRTTLGRRVAGDRVNVESALRVGDPLGGHLVQGHVDGVGRVLAVERHGDDVRIRVGVPDALRGAAIPKGSVAVDGVSLTVGETSEDEFSVYLIPHTLAVTGLGEKTSGDEVNLEADVIGRYVEHHVQRMMGTAMRDAGIGGTGVRGTGTRGFGAPGGAGRATS